jgi:hypothetical protein
MLPSMMNRSLNRNAAVERARQCPSDLDIRHEALRRELGL